MIKIDGEKIRKLRESQGLTQLYMATAVEVTTDTISRWENKRYPTIKEENAEKLAEALGVTIDEILLEEEEVADAANQREQATDNSSTQAPLLHRRTLLLIVGVLLLAVVGIAFAISLFYDRQNIADVVSVKRIMPANTIPEVAFPVVIEVQYSGRESISIILKEKLPPGSEIIQTSPVAGSTSDSLETKWIHKLTSTTRFSYLIKINGSPNDEFKFDGSVSTSKRSGSIAVSGNNLVTLGKFHWADINGDNRISDQEILTVFDYYSGIDDFTVDIEFIEKMWLGSSYLWDSEKKDIAISP